MFNYETIFSEMQHLPTLQDVTLGDSRSLKGIATGTVSLNPKVII